jgi:hypothetical protein
MPVLPLDVPFQEVIASVRAKKSRWWQSKRNRKMKENGQSNYVNLQQMELKCHFKTATNTHHFSILCFIKSITSSHLANLFKHSDLVMPSLLPTHSMFLLVVPLKSSVFEICSSVTSAHSCCRWYWWAKKWNEAGGITQWLSTCMSYSIPWVQILKPLNKNKVMNQSKEQWPGITDRVWMTARHPPKKEQDWAKEIL